GWGSQANPAGLITLRSEVQIFHPLPFLSPILQENEFLASTMKASIILMGGSQVRLFLKMAPAVE
ncbi:MAG: hypothetical protein ACFFAX_10270, partial [Promethearchaeota archaeon]